MPSVSRTPINIFISGVARGNPGPSAYAFFVYDTTGRKLLAKGGEFIGTSTDQIAAYVGAVAALKKAIELVRAPASLYSDNQAFVSAVNGERPVQDPNLVPAHNEVLGLIKQMPWVSTLFMPRESAPEAYEEASNLIDKAVVPQLPRPRRPEFRGASAPPPLPVSGTVPGAMTMGQAVDQAVNLLRRGLRQVNLVGPHGENIVVYWDGDAVHVVARGLR